MNGKEALQAMIDGKVIVVDAPGLCCPIRFVEGAGFQINSCPRGTGKWIDFDYSPTTQYKLFEPPLDKLKAELIKVYPGSDFDALVRKAYELGARAP
jgi:hypothetical protein